MKEKKKILFICLLVSLSFGKDIEWMKYKEGLLNNNDKPIFYVLSASYCIFCKRDIKMMNETPTLKKYIEDNFVNIYEKSTGNNVAAGRTYTSESSNPKKFVLNPGMYEVKILTLGNHKGNKDSVTITIEEGKTVEKIFSF